ncbi:MAG: MarR family transcriptional regulator [Actinomycetota bacterium]|nr:MarR family transcriptional regulator [Actinomycetota bacterium]
MYNIPERIASEMCLAARSRRINRVLSALYDERLRDLGISVGQLDMLVTLMMAEPAMRPIDLARAMQMERSTVTRNIAKLEALGLVEVRPGTGRRERLLFVTRKGQRLVSRAEAHWTRAQDDAKRLLGSAGVSALETLSQRVATA